MQIATQLKNNYYLSDQKYCELFELAECEAAYIEQDWDDELTNMRFDDGSELTFQHGEVWEED